MSFVEERGSRRKHRGHVFGGTGVWIRQNSKRRCCWGLVGEERQNYSISETGGAWKRLLILLGAGPHLRCYISMVKSAGRAHTLMRTVEVLL